MDYNGYNRFGHKVNFAGFDFSRNPHATGKIVISKREPAHDHEKEVERLDAKLAQEREQRRAAAEKSGAACR